MESPTESDDDEDPQIASHNFGFGGFRENEIGKIFFFFFFLEFHHISERVTYIPLKLHYNYKQPTFFFVVNEGPCMEDTKGLSVTEKHQLFFIFVGRSLVLDSLKFVLL